MKKLILTLFTLIAIGLDNVLRTLTALRFCGTVYFSDVSSIDSSWSTNYSVSYLWDLEMDLLQLNKSMSYIWRFIHTCFGYLCDTNSNLSRFCHRKFCQDIDSVVVYFD